MALRKLSNRDAKAMQSYYESYVFVEGLLCGRRVRAVVKNLLQNNNKKTLTSFGIVTKMMSAFCDVAYPPFLRVFIVRLLYVSSLVFRLSADRTQSVRRLYMMYQGILRRAAFQKA